MEIASFSSFNHWHWLAIGVLLLIAEVVVSGGFLLWIGLSAIAVSLMVWIFPTLGWGLQMLLFSAGAIAASLGWWYYLRRHPIGTDDPKLNRRNEQYIGRTFTLVEPIINGRGKIHVDDTIWTVKGPDLPNGTLIKITGADGVVLIAEPAENH